MDAVTGIAHRIADIQSRIAALSPQAPVTVPVLTPTVTTTGLATTSAAGAVGATTGSSGLAFGAVLDGVSRGTSGVGTGKALLDAKNVPLELRRYGNGKIPAQALSAIEGTSHRLWGPAARSAEAMRAAARRDGVSIGITDSYRTYASQVDLAERKGLYKNGGLAAVPGTSNHGWGMALDLKLDAKALAWMRENGGRFGFVEDTPREPWHWGYHPTS